ncbi:Negative regulator of genetic competence MecA [Dehalobacter sp. UNSWDHB]|jgi:Negative regulator of genetic competence, sporulation and motility|uniref:adaptor protein MecA n=1 Tax=unclassified Dehalobacter TaxID=2635733 RepID=UPI00028B866F|nr:MULTISPECIES: adaptor protein MecA [unclassified Dehalobacter]AFV02532.1 Negative regulator of genetic competence MecA [Dehalobacter sp. DCA]AFV05521.1 Negative regulator of genetic competence MecA [Dehalobacter sp. CF]EQB21767.1 Negative regulator of genetic competence MecA [Dehalobacter sp. UNSWDHB]
MRILKVNDNTVRIFISFTELADRNISLADLFQRSARTEQFFWELISKARDEVDFSLDQPFWIQATVASEDEFVITVIKQEEQIDAEINHIIQTAFGEKKKNPRPSPKFASEEQWVYLFEEFEDVVSAVRLLPGILQLQSALFQYEDEYYLTISNIGNPRKKKLAEAILDEFGESVMTTDTFLKEHGETIIEEDAVKILKRLEKKKRS